MQSTAWRQTNGSWRIRSAAITRIRRRPAKPAERDIDAARQAASDDDHRRRCLGAQHRARAVPARGLSGRRAMAAGP